jgi:hypothetical protein
MGQQSEQLRIIGLEYCEMRTCDLCGHGIKWCYLVRDAHDHTYTIGRTCAENHGAFTPTWEQHFHRAEREWKQGKSPDKPKTSYIERRVKELTTPRDVEAIMRNRRKAQAQELIAHAIEQRLREIRKMLPEERQYLDLPSELMRATFSILWQRAYAESEIASLISVRREMVEQALLAVR